MKKGLILVLMLMLVATAFTGCGEKQTVLRFATWDSEDTLEVQKAIAKRFEALNPGIKVQVEGYGDGYDQKIAAGFGAKNAPDVMYMWDFPTYQASLEPLNSYMENDAEFTALTEDLYPGILNYSTLGENVLGMPVGYTSHVIYYNKKLFDQAGVPYPTDDWTWDDLREKAKAISALGDDIYGFAFATSPDPYDFEQYYWSFGTSYLSEDGTQMEGYFNSPEAVAMMQQFADMVKDGSALAAQDSVSKSFRGGNVAMQESGIWPLERHIESIGAENLGVVQLPKATATEAAASVMNSSAICIAKDSKQKDLAWKFVKFYTSPEAVEMRAKIDLPVLKSVSEKLNYTNDAFYKPFYQMLATAEDHKPAFLLNPNYSKLSEKMLFAIEKVFVDTLNGEPVDVKAVLDQAVAESAPLLK